MPNYNKSFNFRNGVQVDDDNFVVNPNGLVGIGTSIPREFLDVYGTAKVTGLVTTTSLAVTGISTFYNDVKVGSAITLSPSTGAVRATTFYGSAAGLTGFYAVARDGWYIDSGNSGIFTSFKVGIGTTNPQHSLQVGQNPSTGNGFSVDGATGNVKATGIITAARFSGPGDEVTSINASAITSGTLDNARLSSNISVGIVTATTFYGSLTGTATTASSLTGTPNISVGIVTSTNLISGISSVGISTISTRLYAESIGVGTNSPSSDVHIRRTSTSTLQLTSDGAEAIIAIGRSTALTGNNGALRFGNTSGIYPYSSTKSLDIINYGTGNINNYLDFGTPGIGTGNFNWFYRSNPIMSLTYGGNLGIGFTNPTEKLRVAGIASISGSLFVDQDLKVTQNATILGNLNVTGTATLPSIDFVINETSGISTFYDIKVTNTALVNTSIGIGNINPLAPIHIGDYSADPTNSVVISTSGIGIGTIALYDGCGIYGLGIDALLGVVAIGSTLTPDLPNDIRLSVKNGSTQLENVKVAGVTTSIEGFTSGIGITNPVKITVTGNILTFTVAGVGVTSLRLY
jgi:hypothetical protein